MARKASRRIYKYDPLPAASPPQCGRQNPTGYPTSAADSEHPVAAHDLATRERTANTTSSNP